MHRFPTPTPPQLVVEFRAGTVVIETADVDETTIELRDRSGDETSEVVRRTVIEQRGNDVIVLAPRRDGFSRSVELDLRVTAPHATTLRIASGSADITARGHYGATNISSGSGAVSVDDITGAASVHAGSGDVRIGSVTGDLDIATGSGRIGVGSVTGATSAKSGSGDVELGTGGTSLRVKTGSGDVAVERAPSEVRASTGSGDVRIDAVERGDVHVRVASGDIRAGVLSGSAAWLDVRTVSGRVSSELEAGPAPEDAERQVRLHLQSVSGDIDLVRV